MSFKLIQAKCLKIAKRQAAMAKIAIQWHFQHSVWTNRQREAKKEREMVHGRKLHSQRHKPNRSDFFFVSFIKDSQPEVNAKGKGEWEWERESERVTLADESREHYRNLPRFLHGRFPLWFRTKAFSNNGGLIPRTSKQTNDEKKY